MPLSPANVAIAAAEALTLEELARDTGPLLKELVDASGILFYRHAGVGPVEGLGGDFAHVMHEYGAEHQSTDPTQRQAFHLPPRPRVVLATRLVRRTDLRRSLAYVDFYRPYEIEHATCVWLTDRPYASPGMLGVFITRPRSRNDFGDEESARLDAVLPSLVSAARRCERFERLERDRDGLTAVIEALDREASVVVDASGHVLWMSRHAVSVFPHETPPTLIGAARHLLAASARSDISAPPRTSLTIDVPGGPVRAELSLVTSDTGPRVVLVRIDLPQTRPIEELKASFGLTSAEARVLRLVALGLTNSAIAARLEVSIETVRTHVAHILSKLGVSSRVQAGLAVWSAQRPTET